MRISIMPTELSISEPVWYVRYAYTRSIERSAKSISLKRIERNSSPTSGVAKYSTSKSFPAAMSLRYESKLSRNQSVT